MRALAGVPAAGSVDAFLAALADAAGEAETACAVQAFDAALVVDRAHLRAAVDHADRAVARGEAVARERAVEILLYAAGRRQIDRALEMGVTDPEEPVVVVVAAAPDADAPERVEERVAERVAAALTVREGAIGEHADERRVREFFDVSDAEWEATDAALSALVRERVALLDVEK